MAEAINTITPAAYPSARSRDLQPCWLHVFTTPSGAQHVFDYDDYDEAMLQFDEGGLADHVGGTYAYSVELPTDRKGEIRRFNAESELAGWKFEQGSEARFALELTRFYHGAR